MRIKSGFVMHTMANENVVVAVGERTKEFHGMIRLNGTGAFLWKQMEKPFIKESLVDALMNSYEVDREQASQAVEGFVAKLLEAGILE